jgi:hypothetical protein
MRTGLSFGIVVLFASLRPAGADEFKPPPMRDGLWETHSVLAAAGKTESDITIKMCQSKELTQQSQATSDEMRKRDQCTSVVTQQSGDKIIEESRCAKGPNAGAVTKFVYSHTGDTASHIEVHSLKGGAEHVTTMDMKYLSSCPAGMKPGDVIMPDGKKMGAN